MNYNQNKTFVSSTYSLYVITCITIVFYADTLCCDVYTYESVVSNICEYTDWVVVFLLSMFLNYNEININLILINMSKKRCECEYSITEKFWKLRIRAAYPT